MVRGDLTGSYSHGETQVPGGVEPASLPPQEGAEVGVVQLPDELKQVIDRQVEEGRVSSEASFLEEAVRRYATELDLEDEVVAVARAGIADLEAGRYKTLSSPEDVEAQHERTMARLRARLADRS